MMKKYTLFFTSALTAAAFCGCVAPEKTDSADTVQYEAPETEAPKEAVTEQPAAGDYFAAQDKARADKRAQKLAAKAAEEQARKEAAKQGVKPAPAPKPDPANVKARQKYEADLRKKFDEARRFTYTGKMAESDKILNELDADKNAPVWLKHQIITLRPQNLVRQQKFNAVIAYADRMLADKSLPESLRPAMIELKANALRSLKKYSDERASLQLWLCEDISDGQVFNVKRAVVFSLENEGRAPEAVAVIYGMEQAPKLTDREKMQLIEDVYAIASRTGDLDLMKKTIDRIDAIVKDPAKNAQRQLNMAARCEQLKKAAEASKIRYAIVNDATLPMSVRINAYIAIANPIRNSEWGNKRRIFYELGNTLLKNSKFNPWKGKPAFENAAAEVQARKLEDLSWTVDAVKELELSGANKVTLSLYLIDAAGHIGSNELSDKFSQMILDTPEANANQKHAAYTKLFNSALNKRQFAEADKLADRAIEHAEKWQGKGPSMQQLAEACAMKARVLAVQEKCDEAAAYLRAQINNPKRKSPAMYRALADIYAYFFRTEDVVKVRMEMGDVAGAISALNERYPDRALAMAEKYLSDASQKEDLRITCMGYFLYSTPKANELRKKYPDILAKVPAHRLFDRARMAATYGDYALADEMLDLFNAKSRPFGNVEYMQISFSTYAALNNTAKIHAYATGCAAAKDVKDDLKRTAKFVDGAISLPQKIGTFKTYYDAFPFGNDVTSKQRSDLLLYTAQLMMNAKRFDMASEVHKVYESLYKAEPKKKYVIHFSDTPILGLQGFLNLKDQPEKQLMDRKFGGNMDFLTTDVSTGERAAGIGSDKKGQMKPTEMQVICDEYGVHFLFTAYDDKALEFQAGLGNAGSFEMYLAPGINQPYFCFLPNLNTGVNSIWDTTYNNAQWRRLDPKTSGMDAKSDKLFSKNGYMFYMFLGWTKFYDKLPETGDLWEFENVHWSRFGGYSWNGIKTVHGRSSWGHLTFQISKSQSAKIKRHIIFEARQAYQKEKRTSGSCHGAIDRWANDTVLGDPEFYLKKVAPVTQKLDDALKLVKVDMDDATVEKLFKEAVPGWFEIRYVMSDLRRRYLEEKLSE